jgi:hypothetical protein
MRYKEQKNFKRIVLDVPPAIHQWIKITAKERNLTVASFMRRLIMAYFLEEQNRNK